MRAEAPAYFNATKIISLDYDLSGSPYCETGDPGTGQEIVEFLLNYQAFCPVILHTSLDNRGKTLAAMLQAAGWQSEWIGLKDQNDLKRWEMTINVWTSEEG